MSNTLILRLVFSIICILYLLFGLILSKSNQNIFLGIRTKWAMKDNIIWDKSNKLAGKLMIISAALLVLFMIFINDNFIQNLKMIFSVCFFSILLLPVIIPSIYSYILYKNKK